MTARRSSRSSRPGTPPAPPPSEINTSIKETNANHRRSNLPVHQILSRAVVKLTIGSATSPGSDGLLNRKVMTAIRAARLHKHGEPLVVETIELGPPGEGEVRVELEFGGVNPVDRYVAEGRVAPDGPLPRTLGAEAAGTRRRTVGAGRRGGPGRRPRRGLGVGGQRPEAAVVTIPEEVAPGAAAAMGIAGLTALQLRADAGPGHRRGSRVRARGQRRRGEHDRLARRRGRRHGLGSDRLGGQGRRDLGVRGRAGARRRARGRG